MADISGAGAEQWDSLKREQSAFMEGKKNWTVAAGFRC